MGFKLRLAGHKDAVDYVTQWLDAEASTEAWKRIDAKTRQGLFVRLKVWTYTFQKLTKKQVARLFPAAVPQQRSPRERLRETGFNVLTLFNLVGNNSKMSD